MQTSTGNIIVHVTHVTFMEVKYKHKGKCKNILQFASIVNFASFILQHSY